MVSRHTERMVTKTALWAGIVLLGMLLLLLLKGTWGVYGKMQEAAALRSEAVQAYEELSARKALLETTLGDLETPRGIEREIRSKFPLVRPGEEEYVFLEDEQAPHVSQDRQSMWGWFSSFFR